MNPLERLEIHLENSHEGTYQTGQNVPGKLVVILRRSLKIQGIEIKVRGRGHAQWNEGDVDTEQLLFETEDYTKQSIVVAGKVPDKSSPPHIVFLDSGQNTFHFNFTIPENIPSSFEGLHGYIRYWVKAKIYGVWGLLDQSGKVEFGVQRPLDLNTVPGAMCKIDLSFIEWITKAIFQRVAEHINYANSLENNLSIRDVAEDEDSCIMCGCCVNNGYVHASLRINKRGFTPGESIVFTAELHNGSDSSLKASKVKFYRVVTYGDSPFESNTIEKKTLSEKTRGKIKPGRVDIYQDEELKIPTLIPVTSLPGCSFIDVDYVVELKVRSSVEEYNLRIPLLVIIGTVPFGGSLPENRPIEVNHETLYQPFQPDPVIADAGKRITTPTISVAPIGTELQALYPPMRNLSILERERTLGEIYKRRKRAVRFVGRINEGAEFDDAEIYQESKSGRSREASYVSVNTIVEHSQRGHDNETHPYMDTTI